jgi:hypothetical protein
MRVPATGKVRMDNSKHDFRSQPSSLINIASCTSDLTLDLSKSNNTCAGNDISSKTGCGADTTSGATGYQKA